MFGQDCCPVSDHPDMDADGSDAVVWYTYVYPDQKEPPGMDAYGSDAVRYRGNIYVPDDDHPGFWNKISYAGRVPDEYYLRIDDGSFQFACLFCRQVIFPRDAYDTDLKCMDSTCLSYRASGQQVNAVVCVYKIRNWTWIGRPGVVQNLPDEHRIWNGLVFTGHTWKTADGARRDAIRNGYSCDVAENEQELKTWMTILSAPVPDRNRHRPEPEQHMLDRPIHGLPDDGWPADATPDFADLYECGKWYPGMVFHSCVGEPLPADGLLTLMSGMKSVDVAGLTDQIERACPGQLEQTLQTALDIVQTIRNIRPELTSIEHHYSELDTADHQACPGQQTSPEHTEQDRKTMMEPKTRNRQAGG